MTAYFILAIQANLMLAAIAKIFRVVDFSGAVAGGLLGIVIMTFARLPGYVPFAVYVVGGAAATRIGAARGPSGYARGDSETTRTARQAVANCLPPALFALWCPAPAGYVALASGFAAALADTVSGEFGMVANRHPVHLLTLSRTAAGTDGAVSFEGTLYGLAGASVVALSALFAGAIAFADLWIVIAAGAVGNFADSLIGGFLELSAVRRGITFTGRFACVPHANEMANFFGVSTACAIGFILARLAM